MDGLENIKKIYAESPLRKKFIPKIDNVLEMPDKEIHFIGIAKSKVKLIIIFDMAADYFFSVTGFDRIRITENGKINQGNYNLVARYLNRTLKKPGEANLALFEYISRERYKFEDLGNEFLNLKMSTSLSVYIKEMSYKLDGYGMTSKYREIMRDVVKPRKRSKKYGKR